MTYVHSLEAMVAHYQRQMSDLEDTLRDERKALQSMEDKYNDVKKQRDCVAAVSNRLGIMFDDLLKADAGGEFDKPFEDILHVADLVRENEKRRIRIRELEATLLEKTLQLQICCRTSEEEEV
jgi:phage shock protein A